MLAEMDDAVETRSTAPFVRRRGRVETLPALPLRPLIAEYTPTGLSVLPSEVLLRLQRGDPSWEDLVPPAVVPAIKKNRYFGYSKQSLG